MPEALLDTDTLSEIIKRRDDNLLARATTYLDEHGVFTFSIITRYEILRGLKARSATRQIAGFDRQCQQSKVLPLTDEGIVRAAELYADLKRRGALISDADLLIAATAMSNDLQLVTNNTAHFSRIGGLRLTTWRSQPS